jgi:hypothetical protein
MRITRSLLVASAAAFTLGGATTLARAADHDTHVMTVQLPNGAIEQIRYTGDVAPRVVVAPGASQVAFPFVAASVGDPFAMMRRISAIMDQEAAAMLQAAGGMAAQPFGSPTQADVGAAPFGEQGYGVIATGAGVCARSVEITYTGHGQPHVVSQTAGDCGRSAGSAVPAQLRGPMALPRDAKTIQVKDHTASSATHPDPSPDPSMVRQIADWER